MFDPTKKCPLFRKPCLKHDCALYMPLRGQHPQTGAPVDEYGCAIYWTVIVTLEGNKETLAVAGEIEALRKIVTNEQGQSLPVIESIEKPMALA